MVSAGYTAGVMREDRAKANSQMGQHAYLTRFWNELTDEERKRLLEQFKSFKISEFTKMFEQTFEPDVKNNDIVPIDMDHYAVAENIEPEQMKQYWDAASVKNKLTFSLPYTSDLFLFKGLTAIAAGEVAVVVLAGGQATRLGAKQPKGTVSLGFNVKNVADSLFAFQAARIARLQDLAEAKEIVPAAGLTMSQVIVIKQGTVPCFDPKGCLFLATKSSIAVSPDGNGGILRALEPYQYFCRSNNIKYFHVYSVDNVLCRVGDPHFIGYCIKEEADCAAKVIEKIEPFENLGVICKAPSGIQVLEYSEIADELATARDQTGRLRFRAGNIANHFFTYDFFERVWYADGLLPYHRAFKKIPYIDRTTGELVDPEKENGYKLELFIFDLFKFSENFRVWQVNRAQEYSPLKNADSAGKECMSTCRRDYYAECKRWLENAGVQVQCDRPIFIHPSFSYAGEELECYREEPLTADLAP
ncbi:unnamed protein product [Gongylonema pulchrum]|uniref:UDP-N-acetylglucosamine diphosphorylase n=1 Tax=Gongylonema pulchrum TaxID=637853 RepID=A0A183DUK7_9BILA|nr:unnamed protein product [Gongylonema pulchrum]